MSDDTASVEDLRNKIDDITISMIRLFVERMKTSARLGELKRTQDIPVVDGSREAVLRNIVLQEATKRGLSRDVAARFLNHLINETVKEQADKIAAHLAIFGRAKAMEAEGRDIIHMEVGQPDFKPPAVAGEALLEGFRAGLTKYGLPAGSQPLRNALAEDLNDRYRAGMAADHIMVTPGARFAVFAAITTLLHPGDELVIIDPAWPAYRRTARYCGAKPRIVHTTLENNWEPSLQDIENTITSQTRMIVLSYPSNPTGKILPQHTLDGIMELAARKNLYVLSDEIYRDYTMRGKHKSIMEYQYPKGVMTQSFSKSHAMMGLRIGYAAAAPDIIEKMTTASALCLTGVAGVIQHAALKSIKHDTSSNVQEMHRRLSILSRGVRNAGLEFAEPDGAMYIFARLPGVMGMDIVEECLKKGLALAPGSGFGHYPQFVRLSAGTAKIESGINILHDVVRENRWKK